MVSTPENWVVSLQSCYGPPICHSTALLSGLHTEGGGGGALGFPPSSLSPPPPPELGQSPT